MRSSIQNSLVDAAIAPIRTAGIAINIAPNDAKNDNPWAYEVFFADSTRWKYTCHGRPPQIYGKKEYT